MSINDLKISHMEHPVIDTVPYFSWKMKSDDTGVLQTAYSIAVTCDDVEVWNTGKVASGRTSFITYEGKPLESRRTYTVLVTAWDDKGNTDTAEASFETAFLKQLDLKGSFVECPFTRKPASEYKFGNAYPVVRFSRHFDAMKKVKKASLYATAYGTYRALVNGVRPDGREFAPEFTPYDRMLYYQTYDITDSLLQGENLIEFYVGDGWYFSAQAGPVMKTKHAEPSVWYELIIEYEDGTCAEILSDGSETCGHTQILYSDLYQGEKQDLRIDASQVNQYPVKVTDYSLDNLKAQPMPPIGVAEALPALEIIKTPAGETVIDFGQVIAGRARVNIDEPKDTVVTLEYFEVLDAHGNYINTMFAPQKDIVISNGEPTAHEAWFTFHGFRYIKVTGIKNPKKEDFTAVLLSTKKTDSGFFETSDARINRLYKNIRYSQKNNMMSVPTDCPTREKAGWTGDILIYARSAMLNEDMTPFLSSWLSCVAADQATDGTIMIVSPYMKLYEHMLLETCKGFGDDSATGVAGWSDAAVWVPYDMWKMTGNTAVLRKNFQTMERWCRYIIKTAKEKRGYKDIPEEYDQYLWDTGFHFGEWLVPSRPNVTVDGDERATCKESAYYIAPFFGYMTIKKMSEICAALGKASDADTYAQTADKMKWAIQEGMLRRGVMPDNLMGAYIDAFAFGLVPDDLYEEYKKKLVNLINEHDGCLDTGFLATPFILDVLCDLGEKELAYKVLWQDKRPSWLYEVDHGATTIWEAWDADDAQTDGRFVSFDHYAFGCVDDFMCRHIAGINVDYDNEGRCHFTVNPDADECGLSSCTRTWESEAGTIGVKWSTANGRKLMSVDIPANTTATVIWCGETVEVGSGHFDKS